MNRINLQIILENLFVPVISQILVDARWQNRGILSIGVDSVVVEGTTVARRALEPPLLRAKSELLLGTGVAKSPVEPIVVAHRQVSKFVRGKLRQSFVARRRIRVVDRSRCPTKIRRVDRWPGRATGLRFLGLEVEGQILHVDRAQLAILPCPYILMMAKLGALALGLQVEGNGWSHARKGRRVIRYRSNVGGYLMALVSGSPREGIMVDREGLLDRRCSSESAGREGGSRVVVESGVGRVLGGRPLGATTGFIIGHPNDRVLRDTWRDHRRRAGGRSTGFGTRVRSIDLGVPSPDFFTPKRRRRPSSSSSSSSRYSKATSETTK